MAAFLFVAQILNFLSDSNQCFFSYLTVLCASVIWKDGVLGRDPRALHALHLSSITECRVQPCALSVCSLHLLGFVVIPVQDF